MGILEAILMVVGVAFIIVSFFITDKLSDKDVEELATLSEAQLKIITDKQVKEATKLVEKAIVEVATQGEEHSERAMEQMSNEKIMAISEYSDTVLESINKTHNEVMFLYSMLNDKHTELTKLANDITTMENEATGYINKVKQQMIENERHQQEQRIQKPRVNPEQRMAKTENAPVRAAAFTSVTESERQPAPEPPVKEEKKASSNQAPMFKNRDMILEYYRQGMDVVEIAKTLSMGIGEVRLVIELYDEV